MFTRLCGFVWIIGSPVPLVLPRYDYGRRHRDMYEKQRISERLLKDLETIGLIQLGDGEFTTVFPKDPVSYYGKELRLKCQSNVIVLPIGRVQLTKVGEELAPICGAKPVSGFFKMICDHWQGQNWMKVSKL
jgi:hypothetical protein